MSTLTDAATEQVRTLVRRALQPGAYQTQALHRAMNEIAVIVGVDGDREQALD
jgi:CheY-specific phosphatase CheX